jgi:hypothetical protein
LCINEPKLSANPREIKLGKGWKLGECRIGEGKSVAERQKFIYFVEFMSGRNAGQPNSGGGRRTTLAAANSRRASLGS